MQRLAATVLRSEPGLRREPDLQSAQGRSGSAQRPESAAPARVQSAAALFAPFGQVIAPVEDGAPWGPADADLVFDGAPIRFYLMRLRRRSSTLIKLTRHRRCSQCLASAEARPWWLAVAAPSVAAAADAPLIAAAAVRLFRIEPPLAVKLHPGTWHGGPLIEEAEATFFNLELADTNLNDHEDRLLVQPLLLELAEQTA